MTMNDLDIVFETPGTKTSKSPVPSRARPRRYHSKSRNGCFSCKKRCDKCDDPTVFGGRVKCDESKPSCLFCLERKVTCEYPSAQSSSHQKASSTPPQKSPSHKSDIEVSGLKEELHQATLALLESQDIAFGQDENPLDYTGDSLELVDYFIEETTSQWLGGSAMQNAFHQHGASLAVEAPYLLQSILAFTAARLECMFPGRARTSVVAALHYQLSLKAFSSQLSLSLTDQDADGLFAASLLHAMLAFAHTSISGAERPSPQSPYLPPWLGQLQGICALLCTPGLQESLRDGPWAPFLTSYQDFISGRSTFSGQELTSTDLDDRNEVDMLVNICISETFPQPGLLLEMLANIRNLLPLSPDCDCMDKYILPIATASPTVVELWGIGEPLSLLVLGYWCAFVSRIDQWWLATAAKAECRRIRDHVVSLKQSQFDTPINFLSRFSE